MAVDIWKLRETLEEVAETGHTAHSELLSLRHGPSIDEQYKLDRSGISEEDVLALKSAALALYDAVETIREKAWKA